MSIFVVLLAASLVVELFREFDLLEVSWRAYGDERGRERAGTARWTDFNL